MNAPKLINMATGAQTRTQLTQIEPGKWIAGDIHPDDVPRYGIVRMMRQADGTYLPILRQHSQYVRMCAELPEQLGLKDLPVRTLYRIINAGFVEISRPAPNVILVDLVSLADHIHAARDPEFWTPMRRKQYQDAIQESSSMEKRKS